ncbi:hypothetical protein G7Z17_g44 [Cylindrodendrum hubeiense]|uniref:Peptidase M6-like domain-containing protein n=1 Tax=Cylindrodendrum hubeiense TaxID=595255 RepID=A0A9P5HQM7_9HYPO|nr:hypothetical protein G7Z17_g44 [Cylindrodendrum hubeiense]
MDSCHDHRRGGPCLCPPHPDVIRHRAAELAAEDGNAGSGNDYLRSARGILSGESAVTSSVPGLNDGLVRQPSDFPEGTTLGAMRSAALLGAPLRGEIRAFVVLVDFDDQPMKPGKVEEMTSLFFGESNSLNQYYKEVSGGIVSFDGEVIGSLRLPLTMTEYANNDSGSSLTQPNCQTMAQDAAVILQKQGINLDSFTVDENAQLVGFVIVHAGAAAESENDKEKAKKLIWSKKWWTVNAIQFGDVQVLPFMTIGEDSPLGIACHEMGHLTFHWPDLYDTDKTSTGVGPWCLMGDGTWNGNGFKPGHPSAWCKMQQQWVAVVTEVDNRTVELDEVQTSRTIHKLAKNGDVTTTEYFLLENRQQLNYDMDLPGNGLLDDSVYTNDNENHYKVGLMQADGMNTLANKDASGDAGDPYPGTTHNVTFDEASQPSSRNYDQKDTPVSVTRISDSDISMTMDITVVPDDLAVVFSPMLNQGDPGQGMGGFDLGSPRDAIFSYDYNSWGKKDHLVIIRPGTGTCWILRNDRGVFTPVYQQGDPGTGIGGFDLLSSNDKGFAFDYNKSGNADHLVFYRPGSGAIYIIKRVGDKFEPVYAQGEGGSGIGGFNLMSTSDLMFPFDYEGSGFTDHLAIYTPGTGTFWILRNDFNGVWTPVYQMGSPGTGIGGFNLLSSADRAFAFDYNSSEKLDHIVLYRPGTGTIWILANVNKTFVPVFKVSDPGVGIGGFNLADSRNVVLAYDWDSTGRNDHLALYTPGSGTFWVLERQDGGDGWKPVFNEGAPGNGVGGYDLSVSQDKVFAFDYTGSKREDHLVLYRQTGTGTVWILKQHRK